MPSDQTTEILRSYAASKHPQVSASWTTPMSASVWGQLLQLLHQEKGTPPEAVPAEEDGQRPGIHLGPVLGSAEDKRMGFLSVAQGETLQWRLYLQYRPVEEPPNSIKQISERLGGHRGFVETLTRLLAEGGLPIADFDINFFLNEHEWYCRLLERPLKQELEHPILELSPGARIEQVGYRLPDGAHGVGEIVLTYLHVHSIHHVRARARGLLKPGLGCWLPFASEIQELLVAKLFVPKGEPS